MDGFNIPKKNLHRSNFLSLRYNFWGTVFHKVRFKTTASIRSTFLGVDFLWTILHWCNFPWAIFYLELSSGGSLPGGIFWGEIFIGVIFQAKITCKKNPNVNNRGTRKGHIKNFLVTLLINFNIFLA